MLEAAAFEQLRHVGVRLDAIEGARRGRREWSERAGLPARGGRDHLPNTLGNLDSVVHAELPVGPGPARAGEEGPGQVWGDGGRVGAHSVGVDGRCSRSMAGWVVASDAKVGDHAVYGFVAWSVFQHCPPADVYSAVASKLCNHPQEADPRALPRSWYARPPPPSSPLPPSFSRALDARPRVGV